MSETETPVAASVAVAPGPPPSPAPSGDWRASLPEDLRNDPSLQTFKDPAGLAKSYIETKKLVGVKQAAAVPGADAKPEELAAFRKALGVPDSPEGYQVKPHAMMMHSEWNKEAQASFLKLFHDEGVPPKTVERIMHAYADFMATQVKSNDVMAAEAKGELRAQWGVNYDAFMGAANRGISRVEQALGLEPGTLVEATKGTNPAAVAMAFHWIESQFTEHGWVQGEPVVTTTPGEAQARLADLQAQLAKVPEGSDAARAIIEQISQVGRAMSRAA